MKLKIYCKKYEIKDIIFEFPIFFFIIANKNKNKTLIYLING